MEGREGRGWMMGEGLENSRAKGIFIHLRIHMIHEFPGGPRAGCAIRETKQVPRETGFGRMSP